MSELVVYTCITGPIPDQLYEPFRTRRVRYVAFTDRKDLAQPPGWEMREALWPELPGRLRARAHKVLSHVLFAGAEEVVWIDGSLTPVRDPTLLLAHYLRTSSALAVHAHSERMCIYQEAAACERLQRDDPQVIRSQVARYLQEGYPPCHGLAETGLLLRRHIPEVFRFNEAWWREILQGSVRDQLSFDYVAWKLGLTYSVIPGGVRKNPYFRWRSHR